MISEIYEVNSGRLSKQLLKKLQTETVVRNFHGLYRTVVMFGHDKVIGECVLGWTAAVVSYYFVWVVGLPFMDEDSTLRPFFPDPMIAIVVPTVILVILLTLTGIYIVWALYRANRIERSKSEI